MDNATLTCAHCGKPERDDPDHWDRIVRDDATGRTYHADCADSFSRICWNEPARFDG